MAVMVALALLLMVAVVAIKVVVVRPEATITDAGTVRAELLLDSVTVAPPVGAGWPRVTVHVVEELVLRLAGVQVREDISTGATSVTVAVAEVLL